MKRIAREIMTMLALMATVYGPAFAGQAAKEKPLFDPTVFWVPNVACVTGMVRSVGFVDVEGRADRNVSCVLRARAASTAPGKAPDQRTAPWS